MKQMTIVNSERTKKIEISEYANPYLTDSDVKEYLIKISKYDFENSTFVLTTKFNIKGQIDNVLETARNLIE